MSKTVTLLVLLARFGAIFITVNLLHFWFFPVRVVLYSALLDVVLAAVILTALSRWLWPLPRNLTAHEVGLVGLVSILACSLYAVLVPTVIDRSLSMYFLEKLDQRGGRIAYDAWDRILKEEYFREHRLVDIRLTEQVNSGTVKIVDGCVELTALGRMIAGFTRFYRTRLLPRKREIMGVYGDDLTDPFRQRVEAVPYRCPDKVE